MMAHVFPGWLEKGIVKTIKDKINYRVPSINTNREPQHSVDRRFLGDGQCFLCLA